MTIGPGIAIAAMWISVAIVGNKDSTAGVILGMFAALATLFVSNPK